MSTVPKVSSQRGQFDRGSSSHLVQPQRSAKTLPAEQKRKEKKNIHIDEKKKNWCCGSVSDVNNGAHIKHVEVASNLDALQEEH